MSRTQQSYITTGIIALAMAGTMMIGGAVAADKQDTELLKPAKKTSLLGTFNTGNDDLNVDEVVINLDEDSASKDEAKDDKLIFANRDEDNPPALALAPAKKGPKVALANTPKPSILFNMRPGGSALGDQTVKSLLPSLTSPFAKHSVLGGNQVTISFGPSADPLSKNVSDLNISLGSSFLLEPENTVTAPLISDLDRQVYNVSLGLGYKGFNLGATFSQDSQIFDSNLTGFDVGLGYYGKRWSTDIRFAEYNRKDPIEYTPGVSYFDRVYAFQVGAAYNILSNIRFTGRFTYYTYDGPDSLDSRLDDTQIFILGTDVNF